MAANTANVLTLNTASTNVSTSSYVEITAASGTPIPCTKAVISNNTSSMLILAYGASGSQINLIPILKGVQFIVDFSTLMKTLPVGTLLWLIAVDTTASTGYVAVGLM